MIPLLLIQCRSIEILHALFQHFPVQVEWSECSRSSSSSSYPSRWFLIRDIWLTNKLHRRGVFARLFRSGHRKGISLCSSKWTFSWRRSCATHKRRRQNRSRLPCGHTRGRVAIERKPIASNSPSPPSMVDHDKQIVFFSLSLLFIRIAQVERNYFSQRNCLNLFRLLGRISVDGSSSFSSLIFLFPFVGGSSFSSAGTLRTWGDDDALPVEANFDLVINEGFQADNSSGDALLWPDSSFRCCSWPI